ncbi:hypothetical protein Tco_0657618, partial [Tanacetum coccineum]
DSASELDQGNIAAMTLDRLLLMLGFCLTSIQGYLDANVRECFDVVIGCLDDAIMGCLAAVIMFSYCLIVDFVWTLNMFRDYERRNFVQGYHRDILEHWAPPPPLGAFSYCYRFTIRGDVD